jgi:deoxyribose-phosphate aldolase
MDIAKLIDHTELRPEQTLGRYTNLVREAVKFNLYSVCVQSSFVPLMSHLTQHYNVKVTSVIGFPSGAQSLASKLAEIEQAIKDGAHELDLVSPIYSVKSHDWDHIRKEIKAIREHSKDKILKIILETGLLDVDEIKFTSDICIENGVDYLKTSTGVNIKLPIEKTAEYVQFLKDFSKGSQIKVKASGGIKTLSDLNLVLAAGADRVGTSNSVSILDEYLKQQNG